MNKIRIAVVDDHRLFREGIILVLDQLENIEVVFDAGSGSEFLQHLSQISIDLVLMDIEMPELSGIQTTIRALQVKPDLHVIALTMFSDTGHYEQMIHAGAHGFILKKSSKFELLEAISTVNQGGSYLSPEIVKKINCHQLPIRSNVEGFTSREFEIMHLVCQGYTSQEISMKLCISYKTVETHRSNLFLKSEVRNSAGLIVWAIKNHYYTIS